MIKQKNLKIFADYFQFYLQDEPVETSLADMWTDESLKRMLVAAPGIVGVGTVRNDTVPVSIEVLSEPPAPDFEAWDHVTECSLDVSSGKIVIAGCSDYLPTAKRIKVTPGVYRVRVSYGNLNSISDDGFDGDDRYRVQLWAQALGEIVVIKDRTA